MNLVNKKNNLDQFISFLNAPATLLWHQLAAFDLLLQLIKFLELAYLRKLEDEFL